MYTSGYKPVAHQAPIVLTARLSNKPPNCDSGRKMGNKCNQSAMPGMLAFVETASADMSVYPEPEYYVNINNCEKANDFSFLGIVQTPGRTTGGMPDYHGSGDTNVVHAGGTMTTFNTGPETIPCNSLVFFSFNEGSGADPSHLPKQWKSYDKEHCKFAVTNLVKDYEMPHNRIIGRAIRTSQPGQQLDLIMAV